MFDHPEKEWMDAGLENGFSEIIPRPLSKVIL
jgi:hypothetical protein